jgi:hypothetical protein
VIDRLPQLGSRAAYFKQAIRDKLIEHKQYMLRQARRAGLCARRRRGLRAGFPHPGLGQRQPLRRLPQPAQPPALLAERHLLRAGARGQAVAGALDRNPGAISFYDPRPQANMLAIRGDPQVDPEHRILPRAGEIMVWPAFLHHLVHPNLSDELRVSISFNVVLRWQNSYLP